MLKIIEQFVRRMLMGKGKGILQIPPKKNVDDFANDLYKKFKQNGVPDEAVTNPKDVKAIWNQITDREAQIFTNNLKDALQKPDPSKKSAEVFDITGKKIKNPQNIMGGEEIIETEAQILKRLNKQNEDSINRLKNKKDPPEDMADGGVAGLLGERTESTVAKPKRGLVDEAGSYAGLSSIVNLGYHGTSPSNLRSIANIGFQGGTGQSSTVFGNKMPSWGGTGKVYTSNPSVASTYGSAKVPIVQSAKNLTLPGGGTPGKTFSEAFKNIGKTKFGLETVLDPKQANKGMSFYNKLISGAYPNSAMRNRLINTGTTAVKKGVNTLAPKLLGGLGFLFDAAPVNADEIDGFDMKAMMAKEAQFKKQQQTETFKQIEAAAAQKAAKEAAAKEAAAKEAAAKEAAQRAATKQQAAQNKASGRGGYQSSWGGGGGGGFMGGSGTAAEMGSFAQGGPARQNFAMGKRAFLKLMGGVGAGIAGLKSGLFGLGKGGAKKAVTETVKDVAGSGTPPPYFFKLVEKIKALGDDVTETGALAERQKVKQYKDFTLTEDVSTGRVEVQKVKPFAEGSDNFGNGLTEEVYMGYTPSETIVVKGKPVKKGPEYDEGTAYLRNDGPQTGEVYDEVAGVTDDILEEVGEAIVKKADGGRIGYGKGKIVTEGIPALIKALLKNKKKVKQAVDDIFPTGDYKYDAEMAADALVENNPKIFKNMLREDLSDNVSSEVYGAVLGPIQNNALIVSRIKKATKPTKTLEGIEKTGTIDISNPGIADEFTRFMKETNPKDYKNLEEKVILESFDPKKTKGNAEGGRIGLWLGGGLTAGKGLTREMLKFMAKGSSHGKSPAEMLKMLNPKQFEKFLNDPSLTNKFSKDTGIMASDMVKDMIKKTKTDRTDMIEQLISSARSIKKGDDNIIAYKNKIIEEMVSKGMNRKTAEEFAENLSKSLMKEVGPKGAGPKVTEQGLLELENIQKNLLTKDRQLQASGGRVSLSGGGLAGMLGE